uniref:MD-2-related lipid-recognition domain-containing protein n=1 Tax=Triparma pacifica TaxID=91992 RepID=A0A7S2QVJ3_9STRA
MAVGSASATSFSVCSGKTDGLGISSVTFSEEPVVPGSTLTITVDATPTVAITDGATLTFDILLGAFPIMSVEKDVCKDLGVTCPLPAGVSTEISVDVDIKSSAPAASVTAEVTTTNGDGSAVSCVDIPLTVSVADKLPLTLSHEVELTTELVDNMFATFKKQFNKVYDNKEEHGMRRTHFEASLKRIQERNSVLGDSPTFGVTKFSDMSVEEFKQKMLTYKNPVAHDDISRINAETHEAVARKLRGAKSFAATATDKDWRDDGAVTDVKDQGQ